MICQVERKNIEDLNATNILPQTAFWGRVKRNQGFVPEGFELTVSKDLLINSSNILTKKADDILVLVKYLNNDSCFAYVPFGPKLEPEFENQGLFLEQLSESIRPYLPASCMFIRYDLIWKNQWAADDEYFDSYGNWQGPPESHTQEFRVNYKTENWNLKKSTVDILPKNTFFLDLT